VAVVGGSDRFVSSNTSLASLLAQSLTVARAFNLLLPTECAKRGIYVACHAIFSPCDPAVPNRPLPLCAAVCTWLLGNWCTPADLDAVSAFFNCTAAVAALDSAVRIVLEFILEFISMLFLRFAHNATVARVRAERQCRLLERVVGRGRAGRPTGVPVPHSR
jgi:hypothetical protein